MRWTFDSECQPHWEAESGVKVEGEPRFWRIAVCDDGSFDLSESDMDGLGNVPTFATLAEAKKYAEESDGHIGSCFFCSSVDCNNECIEAEPKPVGIRCPECETQNWNYDFKSPVDPAGDRFVCQNGHKFKRYDGTRCGGTVYSR